MRPPGLAQINKATEALGKLKGFKEQTARLDEMIAAHKRAKESIKGLASQLILAFGFFNWAIMARLKTLLLPLLFPPGAAHLDQMADLPVDKVA